MALIQTASIGGDHSCCCAWLLPRKLLTNRESQENLFACYVHFSAQSQDQYHGTESICSLRLLLLPVSVVLRADIARRITIFTTKTISQKTLLPLPVADITHMQRPMAFLTLSHDSPQPVLGTDTSVTRELAPPFTCLARAIADLRLGRLGKA